MDFKKRKAERESNIVSKKKRSLDKGEVLASCLRAGTGTYIGLDKADSLSSLLVEFVELEHLVITEGDKLAVGFDSACCNTLWQCNDTPLCSPGDDDLSRVGAVSLGDRLNKLILQNGSTGRAKGRVGLHQDTFALAEFDQVVLGKEGVQFNLVGGGYNLCVGEQLLQVWNAPVGDADSLGLAGCGQLLHELPSLFGRPFGVNGTRAVLVERDLLITSLDQGNGPVDQKQVDVVQTKLFERFV